MAETSKCLLVLGDDEWLYFPVISEQGEDKVQTFGGGPVTRWEKLCDVGNKFDIVFDGTDMYCVAKDMSVEVQRFGPTVRPGGWTPHARGRVCSITLHQKYVYGTGAPGGLMDRVRGGPVYVWTYVGDGLEEATWERACTGQCKALATKGGLLLGLGNEGWIYGQPVEGLTRESKWNKMFNLGPCAESFVVLDDGLICKIEGGCLYYGYPRRDIAQEIDWRNAPRDGLQCTLRRVLVAPDVANFWEIARAQKELEVAAKDQARQEAAVMARSAPRREERNRVAEILHNNALGVATVLDRRDDDFDFSSAPDAAQASREHSGAAPSLPQASREPEPAPASTQQPIRAIDSESDRRVPGQPAASDPLPPALCQPSAPDTLPPALRQPDVANTSLGGPCESDAAERFPRAPHEPQAAALPPQALHETYVESTFPQASREPVAAAPLQGHSCTPAAAVPYPPQSPEQDALSSSQRFPCEPSAAAPYATGSREVEAAAPSFRGPCAPAAADGAPQPPAPTPPPFAAEPAILQAPCASVHPPLASQTPLAAEQLQGQSEQRFVGGVTHSVDSAVASSAVPGQFGAFVGENASAAQRQQEQVTHNTHPVAAAASRVSFPAGAHPGPGVTASPGPPFGADQPQEPFPTGALVEAHSLSTAALNGLQGRVVGPQGERYRIDFAGETGERALKPANLKLIEEEPFPIGALVEAHSLSAAALNGMQGRVVGPQGERYRIHFAGATGEKALKPANLKLIEEDYAASTFPVASTFPSASREPGATAPLQGHSYTAAAAVPYPPQSFQQDESSSSQWFPGEPTAAAPNATGSREVEAAEASLRMPCAPADADGAPPQPPPFAAEQGYSQAFKDRSQGFHITPDDGLTLRTDQHHESQRIGASSGSIGKHMVPKAKSSGSARGHDERLSSRDDVGTGPSGGASSKGSFGKDKETNAKSNGSATGYNERLSSSDDERTWPSVGVKSKGRKGKGQVTKAKASGSTMDYVDRLPPSDDERTWPSVGVKSKGRKGKDQETKANASGSTLDYVDRLSSSDGEHIGQSVEARSKGSQGTGKGLTAKTTAKGDKHHLSKGARNSKGGRGKVNEPQTVAKGRAMDGDSNHPPMERCGKSGRNGKSKGGGRGTGKNNGCFLCGGDHFARDCPRGTGKANGDGKGKRIC